jgi:hypothetical protein
VCLRARARYVLHRLIATHLAPHVPADAMDVYVDKKDRVWLLDFSVFGGTTAALLFEWEEIAQLGKGGSAVKPSEEEVDATAEVQSFTVPVGACTVVCRMQARHGVRPMPLMHHALPDDFFNGLDASTPPSLEAMLAQLQSATE